MNSAVLRTSAVVLGLMVGACDVAHPESSPTGDGIGTSPPSSVAPPAASPTPAASVTADASPSLEADTGCGVSEPPASCSLPVLRIHDCPTSQGYQVSAYTKADPRGRELVVFGIYESRSDHSAGYHPTGEATVHDRRTTPHVLVVSSYEPTRWTFDIAPEARVERIILNGHHPQSVSALPIGIPVENRSEQGALASCAYKWPGDDQGCATQQLASRLATLTSREVTDFAGCYRATEMTVEDGADTCTPPPVTLGASCTAGQGALSSHVASPLQSPELHLFGVYEASSNHTTAGTATVDVSRTTPLILALSSYEAIHWTVNAVPGAHIERIILNGYKPQTVTAPAGIPIENRSGYANWLGAYAYAWPSTSGGSDTPRLVSALETLTSRPLTSFAGCYQGTAFRLGEQASQP